jgi:hypothetical protein
MCTDKRVFPNKIRKVIIRFLCFTLILSVMMSPCPPHKQYSIQIWSCNWEFYMSWKCYYECETWSSFYGTIQISLHLQCVGQYFPIHEIQISALKFQNKVPGDSIGTKGTGSNRRMKKVT